MGEWESLLGIGPNDVAPLPRLSPKLTQARASAARKVRTKQQQQQQQKKFLDTLLELILLLKRVMLQQLEAPLKRVMQSRWLFFSSWNDAPSCFLLLAAAIQDFRLSSFTSSLHLRRTIKWRCQNLNLGPLACPTPELQPFSNFLGWQENGLFL